MGTSSLSKYAHLWREVDPVASQDMRAEAFHKEGIVCISLREMEEKHGWVAAKHLRQLGEQRFGKKVDKK